MNHIFAKITYIKRTLFLCLLFPLAAAQAQQQDPIQAISEQELVYFDGESALDYPANPVLALQSLGSVEFWASALWAEDLDYDPSVIASLSGETVNYAVHIAGDRQALVFYSGEHSSRIPFDFTDGLMHHIAVVSFNEGLAEVAVDGRILAVIDHGFIAAESARLSLGSLDGTQAMFVGGLARLRLWSDALAPKMKKSDLLLESVFNDEGFNLAVYAENNVLKQQSDGAVNSTVTNPDVAGDQ